MQGRNCDKCKRSFFNLQSDDPDGCVACFCFGVSKDCKCANLYKDIVSKHSKKHNVVGVAANDSDVR